MGVAADIGYQHRQAGNQCFEQHGAGVLVVSRVDQQIGPQQKARNVAASLENLHLIGQPQRLDLQQKGRGIVLADGDQPGTRSQGFRQGSDGFQAAIQSLGLEAGAELQEQQLIAAQAEFLTEGCTNLRCVGRRTTVR